MNTIGINLWDSATRQRVEQLQWNIARQILGLGRNVVIEWGTWGRSERDVLRIEARELGAAVELHFLRCPGRHSVRENSQPAYGDASDNP